MLNLCKKPPETGRFYRLLTKYHQNQTYVNLHKKQKAMLVLAMQG